jgi:hypothetical protein
VIAARCRHYARLRDIGGQQRVEGAARLEGRGVLKLFELQRHRCGAQPFGGPVQGQDRRPPNMRGDPRGRGLDLGGFGDLDRVAHRTLSSVRRSPGAVAQFGS